MQILIFVLKLKNSNLIVGRLIFDQMSTFQMRAKRKGIKILIYIYVLHTKGPFRLSYFWAYANKQVFMYYSEACQSSLWRYNFSWL